MLQEVRVRNPLIRCTATYSAASQLRNITHIRFKLTSLMASTNRRSMWWGWWVYLFGKYSSFLLIPGSHCSVWATHYVHTPYPSRICSVADGKSIGFPQYISVLILFHGIRWDDSDCNALKPTLCFLFPCCVVALFVTLYTRRTKTVCSLVWLAFGQIATTGRPCTLFSSDEIGPLK